MQNPAFAAVGLYAAANTFILFWLAYATSRLRSRHKVSIGDGNVPSLLRVMRGHANAIENMPMMFVLLMIGALMGAPAIVLHALGLTFTIGRVLHAWHFTHEDAPGWQRAAGFTLSFVATGLAAIALAGHALRSIF
jgi:uncharacterized protein